MESDHWLDQCSSSGGPPSSGPWAKCEQSSMLNVELTQQLPLPVRGSSSLVWLVSPDSRSRVDTSDSVNALLTQINLKGQSSRRKGLVDLRKIRSSPLNLASAARSDDTRQVALETRPPRVQGPVRRGA